MRKVDSFAHEAWYCGSHSMRGAVAERDFRARSAALRRSAIPVHDARHHGEARHYGDARLSDPRTRTPRTRSAPLREARRPAQERMTQVNLPQMSPKWVDGAANAETLWNPMDTPAPVYTTEAVPLWGGFCLEVAPTGCTARLRGGMQTGGTHVSSGPLGASARGARRVPRPPRVRIIE